MIHNYLKIIIRNCLHDGMYTFIIVFGLAMGIGTSLMIVQYVHFELSFDKNIRERDRIYYTYLDWTTTSTIVNGKCFPAIAPFAERSIPEVESAVRIVVAGPPGATGVMLKREEKGKLLFKAHIDRQYMADASALNFFEMPMLAGDPTNALKEPNTMVITRSIAEKFFPGEDPINQTLITEFNRSERFEARITGVVPDPLPNSSFQFNVLHSIITLKSFFDLDGTWSYGEFQTFIKLHPGTDFRIVEKKMNDQAEPLRPLQEQLKTKLSIRLYPFEDFHFFEHINSQTTDGIQFSGDKRLITYFILLAALILIISWANYINLTTARSLRRAKEVGLRKVNGASRKNLIFQFLMEFLFLNVVSILLAFTMAQLLFPLFATMIGSDASWIFWTIGWFWVIILLFLIISTVASGIYPALILSRYNPSKVLKGTFSRSGSGIVVRKGLVLVQFGVSAIMIMSIYVISRQLSFMQNKDLGISIDQTMVIRMNELDSAIDRGIAFQRLKRAIANGGNIKDISFAHSYPGANDSREMVLYLPNDSAKESRPLLTNVVGENYFKTLGLQIVHGRDFAPGASRSTNHAIVSETATRVLGLPSPESAIGVKVIFADTGGEFEIIGVIKDFSLNLKVVARGEIFTNRYLYPPYTEPVNIILVKLSTEDVRTTVSGIEREWMALFPDTTFDYFFLDTYFDTFYKEEQQFAKVFAFFAVIGILISCMGLFGLSLFDTTNRTKEIGIRKTLGASVRNLIWLFSKDYIKLVLVSTVLGVPLGIMLLNEWLQNYPQHINLGADAIILTLSLMLCIALVTVGYHTWRTAHTDPVVSLRNE